MFWGIDPLSFGFLFLLFLRIGGKQIRQKDQQQQNRSGGDRHISTRWVLDVIGKVAQLRDGEDWGADDIFVVDQPAICGIVGIALGAVAQRFRVLLVGHDLHDSVGCYRILIQHEGDDIAGLQLLVINLLHIDERADMVRRFHRPGQDGENLNPDQPNSHQSNRQKDYQTHQDVGDDIPYRFHCMFHRICCAPPFAERSAPLTYYDEIVNFLPSNYAVSKNQCILGRFFNL